jgi:hypothetical protein
MKKLMGLVAAVGMLCLAPTIASASVITFDFGTKGTLDKGSCGFGCYTIGTSEPSFAGGTHFDITGGSGLFAGVTDGGSSVISLTRWYSGLPEFLEVGLMKKHPPHATVPEPSLTGLVTVGLAMVGFAAYRRRRTDITRS